MSEPQERKYRRNIQLMSEAVYWVAGEYFADCHMSEALSVVLSIALRD